MVVTMEDVLSKIRRTEPDYNEAAKLGPEALPHLETLVKTAEPLLASQAAYLASLISDEKSVTILEIAAQSNIREVRVAAAAGSRNLQIQSVNKVLDLLKNDPDPGVQKLALKSIELKREQSNDYK
jgi:hypothetical protein